MNPFAGHDESSRRQFMAVAAKSLLGVSVLPSVHSLGATQSAIKGKKGKAKHVIYLFMNGAMSQLDTFDPKPGEAEQGETKAIDTKVSGVQVSEYFPELAKQFDKVTLVRSMTQTTAAHGPATYLMRTGYKEIATIRHPSLGSWIHRLDGRMNNELPGSVIVGGTNRHPLQGFLSAEFAPVPIGNPAAGLENTKGPSYISDKQFMRRMSLAEKFDQGFQRAFKHREVKAYTDLYDEAVKLLQSKDLKAFQIQEEDQKVRSDYGENRIGQGLLLARRLVERKVRFVEVNFGGWDDHRELWTNLPDRARSLDKALGALLKDLSSRGLLDQTLVVLSSDFGRKPNINQNGGRDHHPGAFTTLLAGGGTKGGQTWGISDEIAYSVEEDPVSVQDFNATIAYALGLPLKDEIYSPSGRPFTISRGGEPITAIF